MKPAGAFLAGRASLVCADMIRTESVQIPQRHHPSKTLGLKGSPFDIPHFTFRRRQVKQPLLRRPRGITAVSSGGGSDLSIQWTTPNTAAMAPSDEIERQLCHCAAICGRIQHILSRGGTSGSCNSASTGVLEMQSDLICSLGISPWYS